MSPDDELVVGVQVLDLLARHKGSGVPLSLRAVATLMLTGQTEESIKRLFGSTSAEAFNYKVAANLRDGGLTHDQRSAVRRTERALSRLLLEAPLTALQREHLQRLELQILVGVA